jgi:4-alpha-glucanotransferase
VPTPGPGGAARRRGRLPLVAEDLGILRRTSMTCRAFDLPGRACCGSFDSSRQPHLPQLHAYTGRLHRHHDNDTTLGWYRTLDQATRARVDAYLGCGPEDMPLALVRAVLASVAELAVAPAADILGLGAEARFNTPGTVGGNWSWRLPHAALTAELAARHARLHQQYGRAPEMRSGEERISW